MKKSLLAPILALIILTIVVVIIFTSDKKTSTITVSAEDSVTAYISH